MRPLVFQATNGALAAGATLDLLAGNSTGLSIQRALNVGFLSVGVEGAAASDITVRVTINTQEVATFQAGQTGIYPDIRAVQLKNVYVGPEDVRGLIDVQATNNAGAAVAIFWIAQITPTMIQ